MLRTGTLTIIGLAVVAFAACDLKFQEANSKIFNEDPVRISKGMSRKSDPAWAPDGSKIAYSATINSTEFVTAPLTSEPGVRIGLVRSDRVGAQFDIVPDGTFVVFAETDSGRLVVASLFDDRQTILAPELNQVSGAVWSPHVGFIAFSAPDNAGSASLWLVRGNGGLANKVTSSPGAELNPSWSPDGERLVYEWRRDTLSTLHIVDIGTGDTVQVTPDSIDSHDPDWSPDGAAIAYVSTRNDTTAIWVRTLADSQEIKITNILTPASRPRWSPDGTRIAYRTPQGIRVSTAQGVLLNSTPFASAYPVWHPTDNALLQTGNLQNSSIEVVSLDDSVTTRVTELSENYSDFTPAWFPDSRTILFTRNFPDTSNSLRTLWAVKYPDGVPAPLIAPVDRQGFENNPAISPDGSLIVFDDGFGIHLNITGSQELFDLTPFVGSNLREPAWAPSGDSFIANSGGRMRVFRTDSSLIVSQHVINRSFRKPAWSAAHEIFGEQIAGETTSGIFLMRPDGSDSRLVIRGGKEATWSPDAASIAYVRDEQIYAMRILLALPE